MNVLDSRCISILVHRNQWLRNPLVHLSRRFCILCFYLAPAVAVKWLQVRSDSELYLLQVLWSYQSYSRSWLKPTCVIIQHRAKLCWNSLGLAQLSTWQKSTSPGAGKKYFALIHLVEFLVDTRWSAWIQSGLRLRARWGGCWPTTSKLTIFDFHQKVSYPTAFDLGPPKIYPVLLLLLSLVMLSKYYLPIL